MKVDMLCGTCGGTNVMRDAWAVWDAAAQDWSLGAVFDYAHCDDCEGETSLQERPLTDERIADVRCDDVRLTVELADGRTIAVPLTWYPRLLAATPEQRARWEPAGGGYGVHWPDLDEDVSTAALLGNPPTARA